MMQQLKGSVMSTDNVPKSVTHSDDEAAGALQVHVDIFAR